MLFSAIIGQAVEESLKFVIRQVHQVPFGPLAVHAGLWRELCINPRVKIGTAAQTVAGAAIGGDILARVMDKRNGRAGFTLQKAG